MKMALIACNHNDLAIFPESLYDRIYLRAIYEDIPRIVYQDTSTILRSTITTSNPISPYCRDCMANIINDFISNGSSIQEAEQLFQQLQRRVDDEIEELEKLGEQETSRIRDVYVNFQRDHDICCTDPQELEEYLLGARAAGLLDMDAYVEYKMRPNLAAKSAVDELEMVDTAVKEDNYMKMALIACDHNDLAIFPESLYDRIYLRAIYEDIPRIVYQDTSTILRSTITTSNPISPYCRDCMANIINDFISNGSSIQEAEQLFQQLQRRVDDEIEELEKLGEQETSRIRDVYVYFQRDHDICCTDPQELEEYLLGARAAGLLDMDEYVEYAMRPNPAAKSAVDELERVDTAVKEDNCVVCLEGLLDKQENVVRMPCKHEFHEDCIAEWLSSSHVCPLCRFELPLEISN